MLRVYRRGLVYAKARCYSSTSAQLTELRVLRLVEAYRTHGHRKSSIDPLGRGNIRHVEELEPSLYGLDDPEQLVPSKALYNADVEAFSVRSLQEHLERIYCSDIGAEFMHLPSSFTHGEREWFTHALETSCNRHNISAASKRNTFTLIAKSEFFDQFMAKKFSSFKRYGLDGSEGFLVGVEAVLSSAARLGVQDIVIGMPHRGRNNLLLTLLDYPARAMFSKVKGRSHIPAGWQGYDDVISHIGHSLTKSFNGSPPVHVSLLQNPSHLEAINPVSQGKTRAKQDLDDDKERCRKMCLQFHGDAAFAGQGVVPETLQLSKLDAFHIGGTVHIIINNQIGFTTLPSNARSGLYSSDVAKLIEAPVLHVNGENLSEVIRACRIAVDYRQTFGKDVVVDLYAYRRFGHNEVDDPGFTQPNMYENIRKRPSIVTIYFDELLREGSITPQHRTKMERKLRDYLEGELKAADTYEAPESGHFDAQWSGFGQARDMLHSETTGFQRDALKGIGRASVALPPNFKLHPRLARSHVNARLRSMESGDGIDWATAEALAFGSLLNHGFNVRLCGQDVERGTFSHRHVTLTDQVTEAKYCPLQQQQQPDRTARSEPLGQFEAWNSNLSEMAVLGFEYGYSLESPCTLVVWESQFGDFWNSAQVMVDNFIVSGESKWLRQSGLVMLLPHGYDGAGPEHSSSRIERLLQLCDSDEFGEAEDTSVNLIVASCSTPAQYFHLLRRQMLRCYRKPLALIAPKTLLRLPDAVSTLDDMDVGTCFHSIIGDSLAELNADSVRQVAFCHGKIFYELSKERQTRQNADQFALVRIEELCPFPLSEISKQLKKFPKIERVVWVQEEPANAGAWGYMSGRLSRLLPPNVKLEYIGRPALPSPAVGFAQLHREQAKHIITALFD